MQNAFKMSLEWKEKVQRQCLFICKHTSVTKSTRYFLSPFFYFVSPLLGHGKFNKTLYITENKIIIHAHIVSHIIFFPFFSLGGCICEGIGVSMARGAWVWNHWIQSKSYFSCQEAMLNNYVYKIKVLTSTEVKFFVLIKKEVHQNKRTPQF